MHEGQAVAISSHASLAAVAPHAGAAASEAAALPRMMRFEKGGKTSSGGPSGGPIVERAWRQLHAAVELGSGTSVSASLAESDHVAAATAWRSGPDLVGRLQFPYIDVGNGNGSSYLKNDGKSVDIFKNITCGTATGDQCTWKYTQSNHTLMGLRVKDPKSCGGSELYSCCLKWDAASAGSALSVVPCESADCIGSSGKCQFCLDPVAGTNVHVFRPKPSGTCEEALSTCQGGGGCTCVAGKNAGGIQIQTPGAADGTGDCRMEWTTAN